MTTFLEQVKGDDLEAFFDTEAGFAVIAIYNSAKDGLKEIPVIFDPKNPVINYDTGEMENLDPVATVKSSDVENARHNETLEIENTIYEIKEIDDDGYGMTTFVLGEKG